MKTIEINDANQVIFRSVRRRLAEAHQLLRHTDVPEHEAKLIRRLLNCTDLALADLAGGKLRR